MPSIAQALKAAGKSFKKQKKLANEHTGGYEDLPDGSYAACLTTAECQMSKGSDRPQVAWIWTILDGEFKGKTVGRYDGILDTPTRKDAMSFILSVFGKLGYAVDDIESPEDLPELLEDVQKEKIGARIRLRTKTGKNGGEFQNLLIDKLLPDISGYDAPNEEAPADAEDNSAEADTEDSKWPGREEIIAMDHDELTMLHSSLGEPLDPDEYEWEDFATALADLVDARVEEEATAEPEETEPYDEDTREEEPAKFEGYTYEDIADMGEDHVDLLTDLNEALGEDVLDLDAIDTWEEAAGKIADLAFPSDDEEGLQTDTAEDMGEAVALELKALVEVPYNGKDVEGQVTAIDGDEITVVLHGKHKGKEVTVDASELIVLTD